MDDDRPLKDNAKMELKPKEVGRADHAPVGSVGHPAPGLTPGGPARVFRRAKSAQAQEQAREPGQTPDKGVKFTKLSDRFNFVGHGGPER